MSDLIERQAAVAELFKAHSIGEAHRRILSIAAVDAVPVAPELTAVVEELNAMYACANGQQWIKDPVAWSLYQVWKDCGGREDGDDDKKE